MKIINDIEPDVVVNCIGYTDTYSIERQKHWDINYGFVANIADFCDTECIKLVHISTDYIYANSEGGSAKTEDDVPVHQATWYSYTKLISDAYIQLKVEDYYQHHFELAIFLLFYNQLLQRFHRLIYQFCQFFLLFDEILYYLK